MPLGHLLRRLHRRLAGPSSSFEPVARPRASPVQQPEDRLIHPPVHSRRDARSTHPTTRPRDLHTAYPPGRHRVPSGNDAVHSSSGPTSRAPSSATVVRSTPGLPRLAFTRLKARPWFSGSKIHSISVSPTRARCPPDTKALGAPRWARIRFRVPRRPGDAPRLSLQRARAGSACPPAAPDAPSRSVRLPPMGSSAPRVWPEPRTTLLLPPPCPAAAIGGAVVGIVRTGPEVSRG